MKSAARLSLRHRRLIVLGWILLTVVAGFSIPSATGGLSHSVAYSGSSGSRANEDIRNRFGLDGHEQPAIAVLQLPAGQTMNTAGGRAIAARAFSAANRAGHLGVADYANTQDPKLISSDGRTTWALIDMPNPDI